MKYLQKHSLRFGVLPALFYMVCFVVFTFPLITTFSTHFWGDSVDASQSAWNLWWVKKALLELHQSPWQTNFIYYPGGVSLLPHDLNATNAVVGVVVQSVFTVQQTYNLIVIAGFVLSGLTMFWLAYYLTSSHTASVLSGFIFTFSSYHFAHLISGHLTVLAMQGIPLFVLCWLWFLNQPSYRRAVVNALILAYVAFTSLYFFLYCVMIGAAILAWLALFHRKQYPVFTRKYILTLGTFAVTLSVIVGPLVVPLLLLGRRDPVVANHVESLFSMDPFSLVIPGSGWRFAGLTEGHWSKLLGNPNEHSVYIGTMGILVLIYTFAMWRQQHKANDQLNWQYVGLWYTLLIVFIVLSMGSVLKLLGYEISIPLMPYSILEKFVPPLRSSGVPVRINVMTSLVVAVIAAIGLSKLLQEPNRSRWIVPVVLLALFIEYLPAPIPLTTPVTEGYAQALKVLPKGGVLDLAATDSQMMLRQMVHEQPLALGYVSRFTRSVLDYRQALLKQIGVHDYANICAADQIDYLVVKPGEAVTDYAPQTQAIYRGADGDVYQLNCR